MTPLKSTLAIVLIWVAFIGLVPTRLIAQGPPSMIDSCTIAESVHFKEFPTPGKFVPGSVEALRNCQNLGNSLCKFSHAKVAGVNAKRLELWMQGGQLSRTVVLTQGKKDFEHLYKSMVKFSGKPSKLVESKGRRSYTWTMTRNSKGQLSLLFDPATEVGSAVLER